MMPGLTHSGSFLLVTQTYPNPCISAKRQEIYLIYIPCTNSRHQVLKIQLLEIGSTCKITELQYAAVSLQLG